MSVEKVKLAAGFEMPTEDDWRDLVAKALKGADFEKRLVSHTADGLKVGPLYERREDAAPVSGLTAGRPWRISARVDHPLSGVASEQALEDLKNGADSLTLVFPGGLSARGYGVACQSVVELDTALAGVDLDMVAVRIDPGPTGRINAALVAALVERRGLKPQDCAIDFGIDPIGNLAHRGRLATDWQSVSRRIADAAAALKSKGFDGPYLTNDLRVYHEAGASEAQELALALATGVAYLRALVECGWSGMDASRALSWTFAVDADQFMGIAKLRAMRRLWARVEEASGIEAGAIRINAESAWRMMTKRDPWVNILRGTMATFAAGIGGADSMTVLPHTQVLGLPDPFARRIARNTQNVLLEESNLWRVTDPSAGAGGYEALTNELAQTAWVLFQQIETEGGIVDGLKAGSVQVRIGAVADARTKEVSLRKAGITGTSEFPLLDGAVVEVLDVAADPQRGLPHGSDGNPELAFADVIAGLAGGKSRAEVTPGPTASLQADPLRSARLAEPFEALRDKADQHRQTSGAPPQVFLASLGMIAAHTTRSTWMKNLLAAGGIEAISSEGFGSAREASEAFKASGARVACVCSSDDVYAEMAEDTAQELKQVGAVRVLLAGRPGKQEPRLKSAGVDSFVFEGQDMVVFLATLQDDLIAD